jgi:tRNA threonylcarbamoyl adenosine modification protein (Sua5/YciO/YrdC/YwlC family)
MYLTLYPENPNEKELRKAVDCLKKDGVVIYPTDTVYGIGCSIYSKKAIERIARIKNMKSNKMEFSIICHDLKNISDYTRQLDKTTYRLLKSTLPGPFTYILNANNQVPKLFDRKKHTVGIRVPDNNIARELVRLLGNPMLSTSVHDEDEVLEYTTDPSLIYEKYQQVVDLVIDGGYGNNEASTIVDCTEDVPAILRQGIGILEL